MADLDAVLAAAKGLDRRELMDLINRLVEDTDLDSTCDYCHSARIYCDWKLVE